MTYTSYINTELNLEIIPGAPFLFAFGITDENNVAIDLTGCSVKCNFKAAKTDEEAVFTPSQDLTDAANGNIALSLTEEETATVAAGIARYLYDCFIYDSAGKLFGKLFGEVLIKRALTNL